LNPPRLSSREVFVLTQVAYGYANKEIAAQLQISMKTVESHRANAMRKLDLLSKVDLVKYALQQGWLKAD
jgi:DNA-binding NarL/FixJ family response regulator